MSELGRERGRDGGKEGNYCNTKLLKYPSLGLLRVLLYIFKGTLIMSQLLVTILMYDILVLFIKSRV